MTGAAVERFHWIVGAEEGGVRLDHYLVNRNVLGTRSQIQQLIRAQRVTVDARPAKSGLLLRPGQHIDVERITETSAELVPQAIPLSVLYEDEWVLVIDKPAGLVVHPAPGHWDGTLMNALLHRWSTTAGARVDIARLGLVHRLDKDTSGVLLVAKDATTLEFLSNQFRQRQVKKEYAALVWGRFRERTGVITGAIARHPVHRQRMALRASGRHAVTRYEVMEELRNASLLRCFPETGRTHQIRVHLASTGHPIIADRPYGGVRPLQTVIERQALHASALTFRHPTRVDVVCVTAPLPDDFTEAIHALRRHNRA